MIRSEPASAVPPEERRPAINPLRGEFALVVSGALRRFDTRLSTVAGIEAACGDRAIVEILNAIILGRRARDVIPLLSAALAGADPPPHDPEAVAAAATVGEAEAFVLALVFALGFSIGGRDGEARRPDPLAGPSDGAAGGPSRSAA